MNESSRRLVGVVDDDRAVLESLVSLLESAGYGVRPFDRAEAFRDSDAVDAVDCVISDVCMPGIDGHALAADIGHRRPDLPFIFITGHDSTPGSATFAAGALRKPVDAAHLLAAVASAIAGRR